MELKTAPRTILGKKVKALRKAGWIPAELYGHGKENRHLQILKKEFKKIYGEAGEHTIVQIKTEEGNIPTLIVGVQKNPITDEYLSVDLHEIRMDEEIRTHVPIEFTGIAPGAKKGLMVVKVTDELEIEALPANLPSKIEVSLNTLENDGDTIHVGDITLPKGVKALVQPKTVLVTITEHKEEKFEEAPMPVAEAAATTEEKKTPDSPDRKGGENPSVPT
ncbi:MAG: 50S ribosomal protein L25 [Nanoarchaeota archaeon]|nr:50S ribosomal protein L25 [Nanoarchaeota archaeon]